LTFSSELIDQIHEHQSQAIPITLYSTLFNKQCAGVPLGFFFAALGTSNAQMDPDMPTRKAVIEGFKEMGRTGYRNAKTFAVIGGLWSTTECFIEKVRCSPQARH
jgi:hypothetical protein